MLQTVGTITLLVVIYGVVIAALVWLLRKLPGGRRRAIWLSFVLFGLVTGILVARLWPLDSCFLPNIFAVWLGDWMYVQSIAWIGDPHSAQAHATIPWLLRVPQVYAVASLAWCALAGWLLQQMHERRGG